MRVLVTRPEQDARQTAATLEALGFEAVIEPVPKVEPVAFDHPAGSFAASIATSANAIRIIANDANLSRFRAMPLFVVGTHSGEAARRAGFQQVMIAEGDGRSLAKMLMARFPGARVLYFAGANRAQDIPALVASAGIEVEILVVYRTTVADRISAAALAMLRQKKIDAVLHYSARSAAAYIALMEKAGLDLADSRHLCLSAAVAASFQDRGIKAEIASHPDESSLLALLQS
jgi:uroporphyrinogen-III synthase